MKDQPNVVVCLCDQLRPFEVGCYGNGVIRTPHIDRLASEGVRFEHAVTNDPVCMPARASLLSGQYARTSMGYLTNVFDTLDDGRVICPPRPVNERVHLPDPTLPEQFRSLGYDTALIGKWHVHPAPGLVGFDCSLYPLVNHRHTGQSFIENDGPARPVDGFSVDFEAEQVGRYLSERGDKPFFLYYNISPPHMPLADAPEKYLTMYAPDEVPLRPNVFVDGKMAHDENWFCIYLWDFLYYHEKEPHTLKLPEGFDLRRLTALYYGLTTWVDDMVGQLMANLEANGLADDTIVVFLSDHGDHLGSHHQFNKSRLIEESIRIPMVFHAPGRWAPSVNTGQVAQIIDLMPTLLDACGGETPASVQGRNLAPILTGERDALDGTDAIIENDFRHIGVRTPTHLYGIKMSPDFQTVEDGAYCFYDLRDDPYEQHNLAGTDRQQDLAAALRQRLENWNRHTPWMRREA